MRKIRFIMMAVILAVCGAKPSAVSAYVTSPSGGDVFWEVLTQFPSAVELTCSFKDHFYCASNSTGQIYRSADGVSWERLSLTGFFIGYWERGDVLYVNLELGVVRTTNGVDFETVPQTFVGQPVGKLNNFTVFGDYVYAVSYNGSPLSPKFEIWRGRIEASGITWDRVYVLAWAVTTLGLFTHSNRLYCMSKFGDSSTLKTTIIRSLDGATWEKFHENTLSGSDFKSAVYTTPAVFGDTIYWTDKYLWKSQGNLGDPVSFSEVGGVAFQASRVTVLLGRLYLSSKSSSMPFLVLEQNPSSLGDVGGWVSWPKPADVEIRGSATVQNKAVVLMGSPYLFREGVRSVSLGPILSSPFRPGDENKEALSLDLFIDYKEVLRGLTVVNRGTAEATKDIKALKLMLTLHDRQTLPIQLANLTPQGNQTWVLPPNFEADLKHEDQLKLAVDVAPGARAGRTIQLEIPRDGFQFVHNPYFIAVSPLISVESQAVQALSGEAGFVTTDVLVYPQPARDQVRFIYNLDAVADVAIKIFNRQGMLVSEISEPRKSAGAPVKTIWDAGGMAPDVYFAHIEIREDNLPKRVFKKKIYVDR